MFGLPESDSGTLKYRLISIIADISLCRLFRPVQSKPLFVEGRHFLHMSFANKGIEAINVSNILHNKKVTSTITPYFKNQSVPVLSYTYTNTIAYKIFNYKKQCNI